MSYAALVAEYVMQNLPWHVEHELRKARKERGISDETLSTDWMTDDVLHAVLTRAFQTLVRVAYKTPKQNPRCKSSVCKEGLCLAVRTS